MNILGARVPIRFSDSRKCVRLKYSSLCLINFMYLHYNYLNLPYYITDLPNSKLCYLDLKCEKKKIFNSTA